MLFVMDKGFYAKHNINSMYSFSYQFIVAMPLSSGKAKAAIDEVRPSIRHPSNIIVTSNGEAVYAKTSSLQYWSNEDFHYLCSTGAMRISTGPAGYMSIHPTTKMPAGGG